MRSSSWFSEDELARSRAYHRPLAAVGSAKVAARFLLLVAAQLVVVGQGWPVVGVCAVGVVGLAWWLPAAASDWWFEFRHEPRFGQPAMPLARFAGGSLTALAFTLAVAGLGAVWLAVAWTVSHRWWWVVAALIVPAIVFVVGRFEPRFTAAAHRTSALDGEPLAAFERLTDASGVTSVDFHRMESNALLGLNALTATGGRQPRIIVSSELLDSNQLLVNHVVAHELSHLRFHHPSRTKWSTSLASLAVVAGAGSLSQVDQIVALFGADQDQLPALPMMAMLLLVLGAVADVPLAFLSRAQERQADAGAFAVAGAVPVPLLRRLHVTDRALLDPGLLHRVLLPHPPPAERLQRGSSVPTSGLASGV